MRVYIVIKATEHSSSMPLQTDVVGVYDSADKAYREADNMKFHINDNDISYWVEEWDVK